MKKVFKYPQNGDIMSLIRNGDEFTIDMPVDARVLSVQVQKGGAFIWALVDSDAPAKPRRFRLAGTGHPIAAAESWLYVGTFQMQDGSLVLHLFTEPRHE